MQKLCKILFGGKMTYRRAFIISLVLNLIIFSIIGIFFKRLAPPLLDSDELKVEFMTQQEVVEVEQEIAKEEMEQSSDSEGGVAGTKLSADYTNGPDTGTQDPNAYSENGNPNPDPRRSSDPGNSPNVNPNGKDGGQGDGEKGDNLTGRDKGPRKGNNPNPGYYDVSGYEARLNANKSYPPRAARMHRQGTVVYNVTFNADGVPISASLVSSSGTADLDKAAYNLIFSGDRIVNTTGKNVSQSISIRYVGK